MVGDTCRYSVVVGVYIARCVSIICTHIIHNLYIYLYIYVYICATIYIYNIMVTVQVHVLVCMCKALRHAYFGQHVVALLW